MSVDPKSITFRDARLPEHFWRKVVVNPETGCWEWTTSLADGYGRFYAGNHETVGAHRHAWEHLVGPIGFGLQLDHLCRVRKCVNPAHLEPVSCRVNIMRGETLAAENAAKTHCVRGHSFAPPNGYVISTGQRRCRECRRQYQSEYRARKATAHA